MTGGALGRKMPGLGARARFALVLALLLPVLMLLVDRPLSRTIRGVPVWIIDGFRAITNIGDSKYTLIALGIAVPALFAARLLMTTRVWRRAYVLTTWSAWSLTFLFVAVAGSGLVVDLVKVLVGRARPKLLELSGTYGFHPLGLRADFQSFPSGHSNTVIVLAVALGFFLPRLRWLFLALGFALALSRVMVNAHYLSDVLGGGAIGMLTTLWLRGWFADRRLVFVRGCEGRVGLRAPGVALRRRILSWHQSLSPGRGGVQ